MEVPLRKAWEMPSLAVELYDHGILIIDKFATLDENDTLTDFVIFIHRLQLPILIQWLQEAYEESKRTKVDPGPTDRR